MFLGGIERDRVIKWVKQKYKAGIKKNCINVYPYATTITHSMEEDIKPVAHYNIKITYTT